MEDMYGRANPKPEPPKFDAEDMKNITRGGGNEIIKGEGNEQERVVLARD